MLGLPQLQAFRFLNTIDSLISVSNCYVVWDLDLSSPRDVLLSVEGEDIILKWDAPWNHSISITPTGYKILKKSKHLAGGKWEVADQITAEFKEYRVTLGSYEMYSYKVVAVYKDRESIGIEPQKGICIRERVVITEIQVMFTMPMVAIRAAIVHLGSKATIKLS